MTLFHQIMTSVQVVGFRMERLTCNSFMDILKWYQAEYSLIHIIGLKS